MSRPLNIHVAGAGAFGLACALELARGGASVTVFDPAPLGANASGVAAGMIAPAFEAVLDAAARPHLSLLMAAKELWADFAEQNGLALDRRGALAVGDAARLDGLRGVFKDLGLPVTELGAAQARALAPGLSDRFEGALFTDLDWRIEATGTLAALTAQARTAGVEFARSRIEDLADADRLVIATGMDGGLSAAAPELALLSPIKGHILRLPAETYAGIVVRGPEGYAAPAEGGLTIGASMEAGLADTAIDPAQVDRLARIGASMFPALARADIRPIAGVRAATPDGLPLVGPGGTPNVLLAVGARRNGWLLAPLVGRIVAAQVFERDPAPLADRLSPGRFAKTPLA
jgi:glycine oxidase